MQHHYSANIVETISYSPPTPIVQLHAEDKDEKNRLRYHIVNGDEEGTFRCEKVQGFHKEVGLRKLLRVRVFFFFVQTRFI